ncbi:hypothetical protein K492DRAFT_194512 [Lichtheimia hyalospora FSU 10163]|nr:hypothetical protein K492DRAFT_194512 [Lichtheimia hyalospora FSU 10163]
MATGTKEHRPSSSTRVSQKNPTRLYIAIQWVEHLEGDTWQLQGVDLKQESHAWSHGVNSMEVESVRAENGFEQHGQRITMASARLYYYWLHVKVAIVSLCIA